MADLKELAGRVEGLTGPDRGIDGEIDRLFHERPKNGDYDPAENALWQVTDGWSGLLVRGDGCARGSFCASNYTASIDAAMKLVPEGWDWSVSTEQGRGLAYTYRSADTFSEDTIAATPAIALTAAALRALSRTQGNQNG